MGAIIDNPYAMVACVFALGFAVYKAVVKSGVIPKLGKGEGFKIINKILNFVFVLCLITLVFILASMAFKGEGGKMKSELVHSAKIESLVPEFNRKYFEFNNALNKNDREDIIHEPTGLTIISSFDSLVNDFPTRFFTLKNVSKSSVVVSGINISVLQYIPISSIPENSRVLNPGVIWDVQLPYGTGSFPYQSKAPVLIEKDDAMQVGIRFSCKYKGKRIEPSKVAHYLLKIKFMEGKDNILCVSDAFIPVANN